MPHAAVVYEKDKPMKIEEVTYRAPKEDEVLVKLAACGVCHSDLSVLNEFYPCPTPVILGHEAAGVVEEVGPGVTGVKKGDHVVAVWKPACGKCRYCRSGKQHLCRLGENPTGRATDCVTANGTAIMEFLGVGGYSEYTILASNALIVIDKSMPLDRAAVIGCAVLTGYGAVKYAAHVKEGQEVAVYGCGGVGLSIVEGARLQGAKTIVAVDVDEAKLEMAKNFGATHTFRADTADLHKEIKKVTEESAGVDHAFDAVGNSEVISMAARAICKGGEVILVGIPHMKEQVSISPIQTVTLEKSYRGSLGGSSSSYETVPELVSLYQNKKLRLDALITKTYSLSEANDAMNDLREGKNARGVLVF